MKCGSCGHHRVFHDLPDGYGSHTACRRCWCNRFVLPIRVTLWRWIRRHLGS